MSSHIAAVSHMTSSPFKAIQQNAFSDNAFSDDSVQQDVSRDEAAYIDANERAEAQQVLNVIEGQIQALQSEIHQAPHDEIGDMLAQVATLSALKSGISGALSSGDGKALTQAMSVPRNAAINNALDETDDKDTQLGEVTEEFVAEGGLQSEQTAQITASMQQENIFNFQRLDRSAQQAIVEQTSVLMQQDEALNGLFTLHYMAQHNEAMHHVFERSTLLINDALDTIQNVADNSNNAALQSTVADLVDLQQNHQVQHAWLPSTLTSLSNNTITAQEFIDTASRYIEEEKIMLEDMTQKTFAALPEHSKNIIHQMTSEDCSIDNILNLLDYYKKEGFLEPSQINQSFSTIDYSTDALIQTLALLDSGIAFQQSILNMQMNYVNLPDADKLILAQQLCEDECTSLDMQSSPQPMLTMIDNAFSGHHIEDIFTHHEQHMPSTVTHNHHLEDTINQAPEVQKT